MRSSLLRIARVRVRTVSLAKSGDAGERQTVQHREGRVDCAEAATGAENRDGIYGERAERPDEEYRPGDDAEALREARAHELEHEREGGFLADGVEDEGDGL